MFPQWTEEITERYVKGEDQLGIQGAAQSYQQYLVPGVITTTDRARYYSFYAWVLYRFITDGETSRLLKDFRGEYFKKHEVALIVASYSHHREGGIKGLIGSGNSNAKAENYWESGDPISLDQDYFQNTLGGFGQYYRTSMEVMGIVKEPERAGLVYRLTNRGKILAETYQEAINETEYFSRLADEGVIDLLSREDAQEYGRVGCICKEALSQSPDLELLHDAFFRWDQTEGLNSHVRRRLTLGVTLDLVNAGQGKIKRSRFRPALYLREFGEDHLYQPSAGLTNWVKRWEMVQIRQMYTFGLECLWAGFLETLKENANGMTFEGFVEDLKNELLDENPDLEINQYLDQCCSQVGLEKDWTVSYLDYSQEAGFLSEDHEYLLYQKARSNSKDPRVLINVGYQILLKLFVRFFDDYSSENKIWNELGHEQRLPLNLFFSGLESLLSSNSLSINDFIQWIYREFILGQHEFIALQKLRYQDYDTFKFYYQDGRFFWPYHAKDAYSEPIRFATLRLFNTLSILIDLDLVQEDEDGNLLLTEEGAAYHQRILKGEKGVD